MRFRIISASRRVLSAALLGLVLATAPAEAKLLGSVGKTYPIAEPDFLKEVEARAAQVDVRKHVDPEKFKKKIKDYRPPNLVNLPRAAQARTFQVDMTYVLEMDIPDGKGGILYPKGYTYNPMDYLMAPVPQLVVINGEDREQVEWYKQSAYSRDRSVRLLLSAGNYYELGEQLQRPVFYLMKPVAEKFRLQAVPCVIRPQGRVMEVEEILVPKKKKGA